MIKFEYMKCKAVIFDLDGTLLDTLQDIADSVNEALKHLDFPRHELEAFKKFIGEGRDVLAARALPGDSCDPTTVKRLVELINSEYSERWANKTILYDGISDLLDELTAMSIKMAVLSNKAHDFTELMVSELLSQWHFEAVVGVSQSVLRKPDPTAALQIAQQLVLQPNEFLYLGDSDIDMRTAIGAGMYPVGVSWGFRSAEELLSSGAEVLIEYPTDLLALV
ncbi:HAD family hydrolase [Chloroflexota bacterium]